MPTRFVRSAVAAAAAAILIVALATSAVAEPQASRGPVRATKTVRAIGTAWTPTTVRISTGDAIRWRAISNAPHTVTAYGGNWRFNKDLPAGAVERHVFRQTGTYRFRCRIHSSLVNGRCSGMCGKVVVRS
jgi:plastocyanin